LSEENTPREKPSFYAVIPANIRYNQKLPPRAILLYGEISALCNKYGMCTATNEYFSSLYGITERAVSSLIGQLEDEGYIRCETVRGRTKDKNKRQIWINIDFMNKKKLPADEEQFSVEKNFYGRKESHDSVEKIFHQNNTSNNNKNPIAPKDVLDRLEAYAGDDQELREALIGFAEMRKTKHKPIVTARTLTLVLGSLDKLSGGDRRVKIKMLNESTANCWTGLFAPKDIKAAPARVVETEEVPDLD